MARAGAKAGGAWDAYRRAGVDVDAGERAVDLMRGAVEATRRREDFGGFGGFASAMALPAGYRNPLLVSSTDGVGTKTEIARRLGRYDTIGHDLVAMCADDLVCAGAEPLFFLDYVAVGRLVPERVAAIVASIADGCRVAGCALVGGETAEHPGVMKRDDFDLAGFCVGVVERDQLIDGSAARAGDAIVGIASSGLHSNGFSLVRKLIGAAGLRLDEPYAEVLAAASRRRPDGPPLVPEAFARGLTLGEVLLTPTYIYARAILNLQVRLRKARVPLHGVAHVTGGGLPGNLPRVLPDGLGARVYPSSWEMPSVMRLMGVLGWLSDTELRSTFNGGIGMAVVVPKRGVERTIAALHEDNFTACAIGEVAPVEALGGARYLEASTTG